MLNSTSGLIDISILGVGSQVTSNVILLGAGLDLDVVGFRYRAAADVHAAERQVPGVHHARGLGKDVDLQSGRGGVSGAIAKAVGRVIQQVAVKLGGARRRQKTRRHRLGPGREAAEAAIFRSGRRA
jgi:hypothetical protein